MKVDVTTVGSFQKRLAFEVPPDAVASRLDNAYKRLATSVRLPGFRPGKAPRAVLEAKFAPRVEADVANDIIQQSYRSALTSHAIEPVGAPNLAESSPVAEPTGFRFTITVDVRPEITLSRWTGMDVVFPKVEVSDAELDRAVRARLESQAKIVEVSDRPAQKGDMAVVELELRDADGNVAVTEPGTTIRTEGDPYYPGVEDVVVGLSIEETREAPVTIGPKARVESVGGRELTAKVKLLQIQAYTVPDLDDDVAKTLGYEGGAAGMRAAVESQIRQAREELARNQARANLLERVIADNPFEVPLSMIDSSLRMLMDELRKQQSERTGRDPRTIGFSEAQVADLRMRAAFAAKAGLILEWVSRKEGIAVTDADLDAKFGQLANDLGQTVEALRGRFQREEAMTELRERILEEKTLDWLLERANLVDVLPASSSAGTTPASSSAGPTPASSSAGPTPASSSAGPTPASSSAGPTPASSSAGPTPAASAPADAGDSAASVLDGKIDELKDALASGSLDSQLDALLAAETTGRNRKGAVAALEARKKELGAG